MVIPLLSQLAVKSLSFFAAIVDISIKASEQLISINIVGKYVEQAPKLGTSIINFAGFVKAVCNVGHVSLLVRFICAVYMSQSYQMYIA